MRYSSIKTVSVFAASAVVVGALFAYALSGRYSIAQTLSPQGVITPRTRALVQGANAYVLGTPEIVSDIPTPDEIVLSPDASAVLIAGVKAHPFHEVSASDAEAKAHRQERFPQAQLAYWDTRTRTTKILLREAVTAPNDAPAVQDIQWFPRTHIALVVVYRITQGTRTRTLMRVDGAAGTVTRLTELTPEQRVSVSPSEDLAVVITTPIRGENPPSDTTPAVRLYTPQGSRPAVTLPPGMNYMDRTSDGKSVYAMRVTSELVDGKPVRHREFTLIDPATGTLTHPEKLPNEEPRATPFEAASLWQLGYTQENVTQLDAAGKKQTIPAIWLHSSAKNPSDKQQSRPTAASADPSKTTPTDILPAQDKPFTTDKLLVATNATPCGLMIGSDTAAVLFTQNGVVYASPVFRTPVLEYTRQMHDVQRVAAMNSAKQIGLGILMYTQDYDENYPTSGTGIPDVVGPYVKNSSVFDNPFSGDPGFVYSYKGDTDLSKIDSPATTQLGYLAGFGGNAIVWADGHVTWKPDDSKP